jgi:aminocarboxymuconate-semialdehyde decarboxylase
MRAGVTLSLGRKRKITMTEKEPSKHGSRIARRDLLKMGATGAFAGVLHASTTFAQGTQWWDARPSKAGVGKPVSIDCHAHWAPEAYIKAVTDYGHTVEVHPYYSDLPARVKWMDERGVQMHVLSLDGSAPWNWVSQEQGKHLAQIVNDAAVEAHAKFPDRFVGAVSVPAGDPVFALQELNRVAGKPGMKALHLPDSLNGHDYLFEPAFAPVLARCEELGFPLVFHQIGSGLKNERTAGPLVLGAALDAPYDHSIIATKFITSGTLDKFTKLEIILPHAGGDFPWLAGRVEHFLYHYFTDHGPIVKLDRPFREYIRRFHYDYLTYYPEGFRYLLSLVGPERIVVGTDIFAAQDVQYPNAVLDQFNLPATDRDRILFGNAKRLLHL